MWKMLVAGMAAGLILAAGQAAAQVQPRLSTVERPGDVHLLVAEVGDPAKPGILFIHGFAQSYLSFGRQFDSDLAKTYHLVAFDLRGHGGSSKPDRADAYKDSKVWADDVAAVMKSTGLKKPILVGWSYGGYVVADYVRHYGTGNIAGINMVGSLGGLAPTQPFSAGESEEAKAMKAKSERSRGLDLLANIEAGKATAAAYETANMTQQDKDILYATEMMMPAYVRRYMTQRGYANTDVVGKLGVPVLFSRGSKDVTMPMDALVGLLKALPMARLSSYEDTGHLVFVERTDRFNAELAAFARSSGAR